ncbi:hypothetical protein MMC17_006817 [Xylographa soralifera]|nr:hypothetical protein [Xylographa soralifera]
MASHAPAQCCTFGVKHEGTPTGKMETVEDTETYIARPSSPHPSVAILIIPDVIGHRFVNAQLIADQFAANGYLTYMPDVFFGDPISLNRPADFDFPGWAKNHGVDRTEPLIKKFVKHLRETVGAKRVGAVGYCFGAKYVVRELGAKGVDVGYVAHPSFVDAEELKAIKGPLSIAAAETDQIFPADKRHESEAILKEVGQPYQINLYSGVEHGFAVRGDMQKKEVKFGKEQAFYQAVQWFDTYLKE